MSKQTLTTDIDTRLLIEEILSQARDLVLATSTNNIPWAAELVFGHDANFNLYWISAENARHSQELVKNPTVAAVITVQPAGKIKDRGLQIQGEARKLKEEEILGAAREYFAKRGTPKLPETLEDVNDLTKNRSWYTLKPTKIYILDEELFGYERKEFTF